MSSKKPAASGPKPAAKKGPTPGVKTGAAKPAGAKPAAKGAAKPGAKAPPKKEAAPAPAPPKPITFQEMSMKDFNKSIVTDDVLQESKKWPTVIDTTGTGIVSTFLRHRDTNWATVPDKEHMEPERLRVGLIGAIKWGKPFILDMMDAEMWDFVVDQFDKIQPGLMDLILSRKICETEEYFKLKKEEDGFDYQNEFNYRPFDFRFLVMTTCEAPSEKLLRLTHPVKIV